MTNMKNVQHHVNYSKIIILKELLVITHPKTGSRIKLTRTDFKKMAVKEFMLLTKPTSICGFCVFVNLKFEVSTFSGTKN